MPEYDVNIKDMPAMTIASVRRVVPTYTDSGMLFKQLFKTIGKNFIRPVGPPFTIHHDPGYKERDVDLEVAVPVSGKIKEM